MSKILYTSSCVYMYTASVPQQVIPLHWTKEQVDPKRKRFSLLNCFQHTHIPLLEEIEAINLVLLLLLVIMFVQVEGRAMELLELVQLHHFLLRCLSHSLHVTGDYNLMVLVALVQRDFDE